MTGNRNNRDWLARAVATSIALVFAVGLVDAVQGRAVETTAELVEKARARQKQVKSFDLKLKQTEVVAAGAVSDMTKNTPGLASKSPVPAKRTTLTSENRLVVRGTNFRYEDNHPTWFMPAGTLHPRSQIMVSNGTAAKSFFPKGMTGDRGAVGLIETQGWHRMATASSYVPVMMAFRGLEPTLAAYDVRRLKPTGVTLPVGGVTCSRFEQGTAAALRQVFWMDDAGLLRRFQSETKGKLTRQYDVRYERRYGQDAFPVSWVMVEYSREGSVTKETTVEVVEATLDADVASSEFELRFPPGCKVHDLKVDRDYLVQQDGTMLEVNPREGRAPESRSQDEPGFFSRNRIWFGAGLAVLVALVGVYLVRRRRQRQ
jgi:hypothetical protein